MAPKKDKEFHHILHPFTFVLQEGKGIKQNFMDYSLTLLLDRPEVIGKVTPLRPKRTSLHKRK